MGVLTLLFASLVVFLTVPLWLISAHLDAIAPGLPVAALAVCCPALAAWMLARLTAGEAGVRAWWIHARVRLDGTALFAAMLPVAVAALSLVWSSKSETQAHLSLAKLLAFIPIALLGAWLEEVGWSAFATQSLLEVFRLLSTALIIGAMCVLCHLIPLAQVGRPPGWIAWWAAGTVAMRVIIAWLYVRGRHGAGGPTLFHAFDNVCWQAVLWLGVSFDPRVHALLMSAVAIVLLLLRAEDPAPQVKGVMPSHE